MQNYYYLIIYTILLVINHKAFCIQRTSRDISMFLNIPKIIPDQLLPKWIIICWGISISQWVLLYFIYQSYGIWVALAILFFEHIIMPCLPINHYKNIQAMKKRAYVMKSNELMDFILEVELILKKNGNFTEYDDRQT